MVEQARLERVASGLAPVTPGWFVVNTREAAWMNNDQTQSCCIFESDDFVLRSRPDLTEYEKPGAGFVLRILRPGRPTSFYHAESVQEDFLVLMGESILIIEDEERHLRAWDFVHCPPGTGHAFVGAGTVRASFSALGTASPTMSPCVTARVSSTTRAVPKQMCRGEADAASSARKPGMNSRGARCRNRSLAND